MGLNIRVSSISLAVLLACSGNAMALGLGEIRGDSRLGESLKLEIPLVLGAGERLESSCFRLVKPAGDFPWLKQGRFELKGRTLVVRSLRPVAEPIYQVAIQVNCGHDLRREYTLMLSPPVQGAVVASNGRPESSQVSDGGRRVRAGETPASIAAELYPDSRADQRRFVQALIRSNRHLGLRASRGGRQSLPEGEALTIPELPPAAEVPAPRPRVEAPPPAMRQEERLTPRPPLPEPPPLPALKEGVGDRLVLSAGTEGGEDAPLRLSQELGVVPGEEVSEDLALRRKLFRLEYRMLAFLENQAETAHLPPQERLKALETVLGEAVPAGAQGAVPEAAKPVAAKPAAPAPEEESGGWWYWLLGGLALAGLGGLGWRQWQRRRLVADGDQGSYLAPSLDASSNRDPFDDFDEPAPTRGVASRVGNPVSDDYGLQPNVLDDLDLPHSQAPGDAAQGDSLSPSRQTGPESILDASVDESFSHNPVMELADIMLSFGRVKGAAQALQEFVDQNPKEALQPWVKLLEVYRQADMKEEFERLAKNLNEHFNVELIRWADVPKSGDPGSVDFVLELTPIEEHDSRPAVVKARSVEDMVHIRDRILESWGTPQCLDYIQGLLRDNRGGARQGFPLAVADELLFLSEILKDDIYRVPMTPDIDLAAPDL